MKKILIIMMMVLVSVSVSAQSSLEGLDPSMFEGGADSPDLSGGVDSSMMQGGSDSPDLQGGADSGIRSTSGSGGFSNSSSGVPKLSLEGLVNWLAGIMNQLVYLIMGAALVVFLYGILKLAFVDGQKPEAREQARKFMFWGIVALFVMVSVWGLVRIFQFTFFGSGNLIIPQLK